MVIGIFIKLYEIFIWMVKGTVEMGVSRRKEPGSLEYLMPLKEDPEGIFSDVIRFNRQEVIEYSRDELKSVGKPVDFPSTYGLFSLMCTVDKYLQENGLDANAFTRENGGYTTTVQLYKIDSPASPDCAHRFLIALPGSSKKITCIVEQENY